jgi:hypothetical protein
VLRIRIRLFLGLPDPDPWVSDTYPDPDPIIGKQKKLRTLIHTLLLRNLFWLFIFEKWCTFKKYLIRKKTLKKLVFWHMKVQRRKSQYPDPHPDSDPITYPDPLVRGMDPQIRIRMHTKMSWICNIGRSIVSSATWQILDFEDLNVNLKKFLNIIFHVTESCISS